MTETYEELRDSATGEAGEAWKTADKLQEGLRNKYQELEDDPRYTEEGKAEKAWAAYDAAKDKITTRREQGRRMLEQRARTDQRFSVPMPETESVITNDTQKLLASQNEASRIARKIDRHERNASGPVQQSKADILKQEYEHGLHTGGVQGGAICRGVLFVADEFGIDHDTIVDDFRRDVHRKALEEGRHATRLTDLFGKQGPPQPPFPRPGSRARDTNLQRNPKPMMVERGSKPLAGPRRRPAWK